MAPFIEIGIERQWLCTARMLGDNDLGAALVEIFDDGVAVESLVGDQSAKGQAIDQRLDANGVEAVTGQKREPHEIAQGIGEGQDFGAQTALGAADRLALGPPFAPCPWR